MYQEIIFAHAADLASELTLRIAVRMRRMLLLKHLERASCEFLAVFGKYLNSSPGLQESKYLDANLVCFN